MSRSKPGFLGPLTGLRPRLGTIGTASISGIMGAVVTGLLWGAPAQTQAQDSDAAKVRYDRKSGKVKTKNTLNTKFKSQKAKTAKDAKKKVDMMSADQFAKKRAAVAREVADKQIGMLKRLIKATESTDPEYPDLLFRLADHYLEKKAFFDLQAGALYDKIYAAEDARKKAEAQQYKQKQKRFESESKASSADAVKIYKALVTSPAFTKYKRMDQALYFYAFELGQLNREAEMKDAYLRLIREYPQSQYIANAYLSFADFYYGKNQIQEALKLYQKIVTAYKDSPVYAYALYKMGWCYLNPIGTAPPAYDQSLQKFVQTIDATLKGKAGSEANAKHLRRDSRRDLIKAYVHSGKPSKAWDFFSKVGNGPKKDEDMARKMMEILAVAYFGEGKYVESTATYKKLQEIFGDDPLVCEWQGRIVVNALATDNKGIQWRETQRLAEYWEQYKASKKKKSIKRKCRNEALDTTKQMATVWHDEAEKTRRQETYDLAEKAYQAFGQYFAKDKDAYEMQFYYAELMWAQAENNYNSRDRSSQERGIKYFRSAHEQFVKVLEMKPDGKYTKDSAYAQMLSMKNALEYDETGGRAKGCKTNSEGMCIYKEKKKKKKPKAGKQGQGSIDVEGDYPVSDYTSTEAEMIGAYDRYQQYVKDPKDKELPLIMYHRVKLMMIHNKFDEARPLLEEIIEKFDGSLQAAWCSEMLVDSLTIKWLDSRNTPEDTVKASDVLEKWSKKLQTMKVWRHPEADRIRSAIPMLLAGIGWKRGMAYQDMGKETGELQHYIKCGQTFVALYNEYPEHDKADTLLWNASLCFEAAYLVGQSIKLRNVILDKYPKSKHAQEALHMVASNYQAIAYYDKAAEYFESFAGKYKKDKRTPEALQNAYLFRLGLGQSDKAEKDLTLYEGLYKKKNPKKAAKIFWSKYDLLETTQDKRAYAEQYLKTYGRKGGADREVVALAALGQIWWRNSCPETLLYDSCLSVQRKRAVAGEGTREKARKLRRKAKAAGDKKKKKKYVPPKHCGNPTQGIISIYKRDKKKGEKAQGYFKQALKKAGGKVDIPETEIQRIENYRNAWGLAMVYTADKKYEEYLTVEMPGDLDFTLEDWKKGSGLKKWEKEYAVQKKKKEDSVKRVGEFFEKKIKLAGDLETQYGDVKKTKSPYWVLAAAARSAIVYQNFADQLYRAEVPRSFKSEEQYYAYCDALADQAKIPQDKALGAFTYCLQRSTEFQFFNEFSRMCEEELQQRNPDKYPATNELFGTSIYTDSRLDVVGVQTDLEGGGPSKTTKKKAPAKKDGEEGASKEGY